MKLIVKSIISQGKLNALTRVTVTVTVFFHTSQICCKLNQRKLLSNYLEKERYLVLNSVKTAIHHLLILYSLLHGKLIIVIRD